MEEQVYSNTYMTIKWQQTKETSYEIPLLSMTVQLCGTGKKFYQLARGVNAMLFAVFDPV